MSINQNIKVIPVEDLGKEDINFPEFSLGVLDKKEAKNTANELVFDGFNNPNMKVIVVKSVYGFPNQSTRDLYRALLRLTFKKNRFVERQIKITAREIIRELGQNPGGSALERLKRNLDILAGTRIKFVDSYFDRKDVKVIEKTINIGILSSYSLRELKDDGGSTFKDSTINWSEEFYTLSLKNANNLIDYDYSYYIKLKYNITKELYILLSKRAYNKRSFRIEIKTLAFEKLGMSRTLENNLSKVRQQLRKASTELFKTGFLESDVTFEKTTEGEFVCYRFRPFAVSQNLLETDDLASPVVLDKDQEKIRTALIELNFTEGEIGRILKKHSAKEVDRAISLCQIQKGVRSPKKWIYACLKDGYSMQEVLESEEQKEKEKLFEFKKKEEEQLEIELKQKQALESQKIDDWIKSHPTRYIALCQEYIQKLEQENPVLYQNLLRSSTKKKITSLDYFAESKMFNGSVRNHISEIM